MKKLIVSAFVTIFILTVVAASFVFAQEPKIMGYEEYGKIKHKQPYILKLESVNGKLLYYGARHVYKINDPQIRQIEKLWIKFRPTIVFNESRTPPLESSREKAVERYGEPGLLTFLAAKYNVPIKSIDPPRLEEIAYLISTRRWTGEQLKLFYILRRVADNAKRADSQPVNDLVQEGLKALSTVKGLENSPTTIIEFEESVKKLLPFVSDWRQIRPTVFDPNPALGLYTNDIAYASSQYRDQYMVKLLAAEVKKGGRIFAVVGASHVVMQERAIKKALSSN